MIQATLVQNLKGIMLESGSIIAEVQGKIIEDFDQQKW